MITEDFRYTVEEEYGVPANPLPFSEERAEALRGHLPNSLIDFWLVYGLGEWKDGLFRFCDPDDYRSVLALLFGADKDFSARDCHVYGYTAFGELYVWSERHHDFDIDLIQLDIGCHGLVNPEKKIDPERTISVSLNFYDDYGNLEDEDGKFLYKRAVKKLGPLEHGEVYGFVPALALGGTMKLEGLKRVKAREHFAILAQLDSLKLLDYSSFPAKFVREIG